MAEYNSSFTGKEIDERLSKAGTAMQPPATATAGQGIAVEAVDGSGKPTSWKAVDLSNVKNVKTDFVFDSGNPVRVLIVEYLDGTYEQFGVGDSNTDTILFPNLSEDGVLSWKLYDATDMVPVPEDMPIATQEMLSELSAEKVSLPKDADGNPVYGTAGRPAVSDGQGGIVWKEPTDEELLLDGITLTKADLIGPAIWTSTSTDTPTTVSSDMCCTRKFLVNRVPLAIRWDYTNAWQYTFWKNGTVVTQMLRTDLEASDWAVNFEFDAVAINFSYGFNDENISATFQILKSDNSFEAALADKVSITPQELTEEEKAQARANIGAAAERVPTDEELLLVGITLTKADVIERGLWTTSSTDAPTILSSGDRACTRKFAVSKMPVATKWGWTNPHQYTFWKNETVVSQLLRTDLEAENWEVDFDFDAVAINFSYGYGDSFSATFQIIEADGSFEKALVIGDSISTDYYGSYTKWVTLLVNEKTLPALTTNDSIHATGFVARYNSEANDFITRIEAAENKDTYDLVIVFGGINDYIQAVPMGESGGDITVSFKPAVDYFFSYLVNNFTHARIVVLSPLRTSNIYQNTAGHYQTEYADYIKEVAKSYCLPVLNLTEESGFCPFNDTFKQMWTLIPEGYENADGVHPNADYQQKFLAPMIKGFLLGIKPS